MSDIAISVEALSKVYRIGHREEIPETLTEAALAWVRAPLKRLQSLRRLNTFDARGDDEDLIWALRDVSFEVKEGEVIGIIGRNGAGKSTLLKILSRVTDPSSGRAVIHGRVSSLLEVGTGFHSELTGRENIYMNGTILGMKKREIDRKFDEIVEFSGIGKFLDTPIKRYSSGMTVRLAFAVAAHLEPEILVIDEVLAVGDAGFQKKCLGKMNEVARGGRTVLFVSHQMAAVEKLCSRGILLDSGGIAMDAPVGDVIAAYFSQFDAQNSSHDVSELPREGKLPPVIRRVRLLDGTEMVTSNIPSGSELTIEIDYEHSEPIRNPSLGIHFESSTGTKVFLAQSNEQHGPLAELPPKGTVRCRIPSVPLVPGLYFLTLYFASSRLAIDHLARAVRLDINATDVFGTGNVHFTSQALVFVPAHWSFAESEVSCGG